jgi:hypothetical protein
MVVAGLRMWLSYVYRYLICMCGVLMYMSCTECIDVCSVAGLLASSQYPDSPATGHLGTGNRSRDLPICSAVPQPLRHRVPHLGGPQDRSGQVRKISHPPEFDPRTVQPVASRYTD